LEGGKDGDIVGEPLGLLVLDEIVGDWLGYDVSR